MMGSKSKEKKRIIKPYITTALVLLFAAAVLYCSAKKIPGFANWYSGAVYPILVDSIGRICGTFNCSVAEIICALMPALIIVDIIANRHLIRKALAHIALLAALLLFVYVANCGINYYRDGFVPADAYAEAVFTEDDLSDFCEYVIERLTEPDIDNAEYPDKRGLALTAKVSMKRLGNDHPELKGYYPDPKQLSYLSRAFSAMGISGIYSPFTIEANINGDMPWMEKPFTACHELSHLRGYMNEGEANYIGWLACIGSEDYSFNRSGWLIAWNYAGSELKRTDPDKFAELYKKLPERAIYELVENHEFWTEHETKASEIQDQVNDAYLKSNGQKEGIASYSQLTTLMLKWYRDNR